MTRPDFFGDFGYKAEKENIDTTDRNMEDESFTISDLLAEDWEIAAE